MSANLKDRTIVVTGATKGIGRATAAALTREGARVVATGRDRAAGEETRRRAEAAGSACLFIEHDVRDENGWETMFAAAEKQFGPVHGLVNNAGAFFVKPLADTSEADFDAIYETNVEGTFLGIREAFRWFKRSGTAGAIVNVSSLMGQVGFPNAVAYCATKGAITAMTKTAALEGAQMSPKVRVNSLHPGVIWTPMITDQFGDDPALQEAFAAETPLRMIGRPEYMADAILFLLGDDALLMTGAELTADGGRGAD
ncbi:MAG TPA: SDR family NAD(P)-dependent oxidoreductase [Rhizomicrobium sp.]|nr:SDR family NAD(P)-dependent oxidoreductase [Rhizomicrobium sp.]